MVCGFGDSVSYDQLVQKVTGTRLDKSSRFTDWRRRPLSDKQLDYALADVTHLIDVYRHLKAELTRENRGHWLNEEMDVLTARETYDPHPDDAWKRLKMRHAQAAGAGDHAEGGGLAGPRGARAQRAARRGSSRTMSSTRSRSRQPADQAALARLRSLPRGWERSAAAAGLLDAVNAALAVPEGRAAAAAAAAAGAGGLGAAAELLKVLLKLVAEKAAVAPKLLASSDDIDRIAADGETANVPAMHGWRREVFGEKALKLVRGELALKFDNRRIAVFDAAAAVE